MSPFQLSGVKPDIDLTTKRFRKWAPFSGSKMILTGHPSDREWKKARRKNEAECIFYQIPRELLIEIMTHFDTASVFMARQTCSLMHVAFSHGRFKSFHRWEPYDLDPDKLTPTLPRTRMKYLSVFNLPPPQPRFVPMIEFGRTALGESDVAEIRRILRGKVLCERCRGNLVSKALEALPSSQRERLDFLGNKENWTWCVGCQRDHDCKWFPDLKRSFHPYRTCLGWEGEMRLCPHRTFTWKKLIYWIGLSDKERKCVFRCDKCRPSFGRHGELPTITFVPARESSHGFIVSHLEASWELPICRLLPGQALTKDMLRSGLARAIAAGRGLVCEHMAPNGGSRLLGVFSWDRCVCFREPSAGAAHCFAHGHKASALVCCACAASQLGDPEEAASRAGKFAASDSREDSRGKMHQVRCRECHRGYSWRAEGRRVFLALDFTVGRMLYSRSEWDDKSLRRDGRVCVDRKWLARMDTRTYDRALALKHIAWCDAPKCMNSSRLYGFWFWPEWNR
ncbi:hypothetical protein CMUS01_10814 [Colletotrichum musicola]|uniref:F-box domain-containing protein n=1 Tax=Colletotrichum musicola TaxID=2175873 RepID=A0A8H6K178_9PEZI|nr:hypothetical protein CMUS01_10814 [Colletotrichum musicola]